MTGVAGWGDALVREIRAEADAERFERGEDLDFEGAVIEWHVEPGGLYGFIEDRSTEYSCTLRVTPLHDDDLALLLTFIRHLPQDQLSQGFLDVLDRGLAARKVTLGPMSAPEPRCQCPNWGEYCKHSVALAFAFARAIDKNPWIWLRARGLEIAGEPDVAEVQERELTLEDELAVYWSGSAEGVQVSDVARPAHRERDRSVLVEALTETFSKPGRTRSVVARLAEEAAAGFEALYAELIGQPNTVPLQTRSGHSGS